MNISRFSPSSRFVLVVCALYGTFALGCVLDDGGNNSGGNNSGGGGNNGGGNNGGGNNGGNNADCVSVVNDDVDFTDDVELCAEVTVERSIRLSNNATLTIKPGTTMTVCADCLIEVGAFGDAATLLAEGTAEEPITIRGVTEEAGFWEALYIRDNATSNSKLSHVVIADAGGNDADAALTLEKGIKLNDLTIEDSDASGFIASEFDDEASNITVRNVADFAGILTGGDAVTFLPLEGSYSEGVSEGAIRVDLATLSDVDVVFSDPGVPYVIAQNIRMSEGGNVTVNAGVTLKMGVDTYIEAGAFGDAAALVVAGTSEAPVVFEGAVAEAGFWDGIYVRDSATSATSFEHMVLRHGGGQDNACLNLDTDVDVKNVTIEACETAGFTVGDVGFGEDSEALTVTGVEGPAGTASWSGALTIPRGGSFTGNDDDEIRVTAPGNGAASGNLPLLDVPYLALANWRITSDASITIDPGVEIKFGPDNYIEVGAFGSAATFVAVGASNERIVFTGADASAGTWAGIYLRNSVTSNTRLDFIEVNYGGTDSDANLTVDADVEVTNSIFSNSAGYGIIVGESAGTNDYAATNTFTNNALGEIDDRRN